MEIRGINHLHGPQSLQGTHRIRATEAPPMPESLQGADQLELSSASESIGGQGLSVHGLNGMGAVHSTRVAQIRAEIAAGIYETPDKLETAVGRLLDELSG